MGYFNFFFLRMENTKAMEKEKLKREREAETKKIQEEARARKMKKKAERAAIHEAKQAEAIQRKAEKAAVRRERHAQIAAEQEAKTIERKQREVTIEFSDFPSIKAAIQKELVKYGEVENFRRTLSGCEARFSDMNGAQEAVAAGEIEATIQLSVQPVEIKQHSVHFQPAEGVEINADYLKKVNRFFTKKAKAHDATVTTVTKKRGAVLVCLNSREARDAILEEANAESWSVASNPIGEVHAAFPMKASAKKKNAA